MGQAFITRRGGGGYSEGDIINSANITPIYDADSLNFTTYDVIKDMASQFERIYVNPQGTRIYGYYNYSSSTARVTTYSINGTQIASKYIALAGYPTFDSQGNMYCNTTEDDGNSYYVYQFKTDGTAKQFQYAYSGTSVFWANNLLNIVASSTLYQFNVSGTQTGTISLPNSNIKHGCQGDGSNIYLIGSNSIFKMTSTGTKTWTASVPLGYGSPSVAYNNGYVYYVDGQSNQSSIKRVSSSGTLDSSWASVVQPTSGKISVVTIGTKKYLKLYYNNTTTLTDFSSKATVLSLADTGVMTKSCYDIANDTGVPYYWANKLFELHTAPTGYQIIE